MILDNLTYEQANYMLRSGRATIEDAQRFCEVWNKTKCSTEAHCLEKIERLHGFAMRVPRIIIVDLE